MRVLSARVVGAQGEPLQGVAARLGGRDYQTLAGQRRRRRVRALENRLHRLAQPPTHRGVESAYHARQLPAICGKALPPQLFDLLHLVPTTADSTVAVRGSS
jgi:hypothetical protein